MKIKKFFRQVFCRHKWWSLRDDGESFECISCGQVTNINDKGIRDFFKRYLLQADQKPQYKNDTVKSITTKQEEL